MINIIFSHHKKNRNQDIMNLLFQIYLSKNTHEDTGINFNYYREGKSLIQNMNTSIFRVFIYNLKFYPIQNGLYVIKSIFI